MNPPFYACSIPLGPGQEVARGSGGQTREITPPIANIPTPPTKEYIRTHWIKRDWAALIEGMLDDTIRWSASSSKLIGTGEEQAGSAPLDEEPVPAPVAEPRRAEARSAAPARGNGRRELEENLL
jgi:hypothetical protein